MFSTSGSQMENKAGLMMHTGATVHLYIQSTGLPKIFIPGYAYKQAPTQHNSMSMASITTFCTKDTAESTGRSAVRVCVWEV